MTKFLIATATVGLTAMAAAHSGTKAATEVLSEAQTAHQRAVADHNTATTAETNAKVALDGATEAHAKAEGEAKDAAKVSVDEAKKNHDTAAKATKTAHTAVGKAQKAVDAADKKAKAEQEKASKAEAKEQAKKAKEAEKEAAKSAKVEAAKSGQQPEVNGVRRPKPDGACGKAWGIFDEVSKANGVPASIGESLPKAAALGVNEATVRTQYARWRKFHGVTGRVEAPKAAAAAAA